MIPRTACLLVSLLATAATPSARAAAPTAPAPSDGDRAERAAAAPITTRARAESYQVVYDVPHGCPSRETFVTAVYGRTGRALLIQDRASKTLRILVQKDGEGFAGQLEVTALGAEPALRHFEEASCGEVVSALALVAALTIDPALLLEPSAPPPMAAKARPGGGTHRRSPRPAVGFSASSVWGPAPVPLVALGPETQIVVPITSRWELGFRLNPAYGRTGATGPAAARSSFEWLAVRGAVCPTMVLRRDLHLGPCLRADVAALTAAGRKVPHPLEETRPWSALGPGAEVGIGRRVFIEASGALLFSLVRDRFLLLPDQDVVHRAGAIGGSAELSAGLRFR